MHLQGKTFIMPIDEAWMKFFEENWQSWEKSKQVKQTAKLNFCDYQILKLLDKSME